MPASRTPSVRRQRLGIALRRLREGREMTAETAGRRLGWSASKISRIETARIGVSGFDIREMLRVYRTGDRVTEEILALAREADRRGWWDGYPEIQQGDLSEFIAFEDEASHLLIFQTEVVPGLLQTEEYARHLIAGYDEIVPQPPLALKRRLEVRMRRQQLIRPPRSLPLSVVLDEAVLLRRIGTPGTMAHQLRRLVELAELRNVTVRVLPLDGDHGPALSSFTLLEFEPAFDVPFPPVVHIEGTVGTHAKSEVVTHEYRLLHRWLVDKSLDPGSTLKLISKLFEKHGWRSPARP